MKLFDFITKKSSPDEEQRNTDRRQGGDANYDGPDRRRGADRRGLKYGLRFKTSFAIGPIEDWLEETFPGEFHLSIADMSDDFAVKEVMVNFGSDEDRQTFKGFLNEHLRSLG